MSKQKHDLYMTGYECKKMDSCHLCFWFNGEQCIRELLTEEDVNEISKKKENNGSTIN